METRALLPAFLPALPLYRESPVVAPLWFLGVDPTAGDDATGYAVGTKATTCVLLREDAYGLHLDRVARLHTNAEIVALAESVAVSGKIIVAIDGPCRDFTPGIIGRPCERAVAQMGMSLYMSSERMFDGARRWMRRTLALFAAFAAAGYVVDGALPTGDLAVLSPRTTVEVYPAAGFALLAGHAPDAPRKLPKKGTPAGDAIRAAMLAAFGLGFAGIMRPGPRHDLHDAAVAALTAYLATRAHARLLGDAANGGCILVPTPSLRVGGD